ncbi:hypothetical protein MKJ01_05680 [Chryseobacterium sp. SSA4.19]|uniref:hypothetical protein n=1 Tax=Chryseobacterium sp. SSA4.19 TaxID=2919915 RepID=UPI001F4DDCF2|nr:hypothetical protein [Chryseobacterium sp. SSA4.19]MCJ8153251.1 hypothetical protein [Chryseobacterium sp. SSA4.19]
METKVILNIAKEKKLCGPWQEKMKQDSSLQNLCKMYFDGDDWSMENDFPALNILREFKGKSDIHGLHTDFIGTNKNELQTAYFGNSDVRLSYDGFSVGKVILRHNTKAKINVRDNSIVFINLLDNAEVQIECSGKAWVFVFCYDNHNVKSIGNVKVQTSTFKK